MSEPLSLKAFIARRNISATADWADSNPNMPDSENMNHWKVTLRHGKRRLTTYFSMGLALSGDPKADDVLDCLAMDAAGIENARSFEDWCSEYGYDTDSRKAERIYKVCQRQAKQLKQFMGSDQLYSTLLWETERL